MEVADEDKLAVIMWENILFVGHGLTINGS